MRVGKLLLLGMSLVGILLTDSPSAEVIHDKNGQATLNLDFSTGVLPGTVVFTRASSGTYFNSAGVLQTAVTDAPRFTYDSISLANEGLLLEQQSTNAVRNNTMVGAVVGTPGTLPTNWTISGAGGNVITASVVEKGITATDFQFINAGAIAAGLLQFDTIPAQAAVPSQNWTASAYFKLIAGTLTNVTEIELSVRFYDSGGMFISQQFTIFTPTSAALSTQRVVQTFTAPALTASVNASLRFITSAATDFTLRIGMPQLELLPVASSVIATSGSAVVRSPDIASVLTGSWLNPDKGTFITNLFPPVLPAVGNNKELIGIGSAAATDFRLMVAFGSSALSAQQFIISDLADGVTGNVFTANALSKTAWTYSFPALSSTIALNQGTPVNFALAPVFLTVTKLFLGGTTPARGTVCNCSLLNLKYYPTFMSPAQLQAQ